MFKHECTKRIRYGETDKMGYLYYGNYPLLYEIGRSEAIRSLGVSYKQLEDEYRIMMPVLHVESRYKLPVYYDELITIETRLEEIPTKMIHFHHSIYNENGKNIHEAAVKLFFVNMDNNRRVSCPDFLTKKINPYFD